MRSLSLHDYFTAEMQKEMKKEMQKEVNEGMQKEVNEGLQEGVKLTECSIY